MSSVESEGQISRLLLVGSNSSRRSDPQYMVLVSKTPTNLTPLQRLSLRKSQISHSIARLKTSDVADDVVDMLDMLPPTESCLSRPSLVTSHDSLHNRPNLLFSAVLLRLLQISFGLYDDISRKLASEDPLSLPIMFQNSEYMQIFEETRQRKKLLGDLRKLQLHENQESVSFSSGSVSSGSSAASADSTEVSSLPPPVPPKHTRTLPELPPLTLPTVPPPALPAQKSRSTSTPDFHAVSKNFGQRSSSKSTTSLPLIPPKPTVAASPSSPTSAQYFSYTRPTWLPPKATADRLKHQRDANDMIERALARESKEQAQKVRALEKLLRQRQKDLDRWYDVLNTISVAEFAEKRAHLDRNVWWRGVDARLRSQIWWKFFFANLLKFSTDYVDMEFSAALVATISNDLVYRGSEVVKVVAAYAYYLKGDNKESVMHYYLPQLNDVISTLCIVYRSPYKAFALLCQMYETGTLKLLVDKTTAPNDIFARIEGKFASALPQLYAHFTYQGVGCRDWAADLILGLLLPHAGLLLLSQLIDVFLFEDMKDSVLIAAVIVLLEQFQYKLYGNKKEILTTLGNHITLCGDHEFMVKMREQM